MERLTFFENGHWCIRLNGVVYGDFPEVDRLAAYENSGLEPYDYSVMKATMDQAEEAKQQISDVIEIIGCSSITHLKELFQAEHDGRLVVQDIFGLFPVDCDVCERNVDGHGCKELEDAITDSTPEAEWHFILKICPKEVCQARTTPERLQAAREGTEIDGIRYFLTKQEAEAALKKREEANNEAVR